MPLTVAGATTVRLTDVEPLPTVVWSVVTPLAVFGYTPGVADVTITVTVQLPLAGIVIPLKFRLVAPFKRLLLVAPVQVPAAFWAPLIVMPVRVSVKVAFVNALVFGFVRLNVMIEVPPATIVAGLNDFTIVGFKESLSVLVHAPVPELKLRVIPPLVAQLVPRFVVPLGGVTTAAFAIGPLAFPATVAFTVNVITAPLRIVTVVLRFPVPFTEPHTVVTLPVPAVVTAHVQFPIVRPDGAVSTTVAFVTSLGPLFVTVTVYAVLPPAFTLVKLSVLAITRSAAGLTVSVSLAVFPVPLLVALTAPLVL